MPSGPSNGFGPGKERVGSIASNASTVVSARSSSAATRRMNVMSPAACGPENVGITAPRRRGRSILPFAFLPHGLHAVPVSVKW